ncbi:hypothetical protein [Aquamicrobium terrae]|uniref:Uncharacterized protein n=1 Tax=Aquamicrobium terrae TaxID=1324945 RepID=A0ABV2MYA7_9HYPH
MIVYPVDEAVDQSITVSVNRKDHAMTNASKAKAIDAFLAAKFEIDAILERLTALSDDHFNTSPDAIDWGHVGMLEHYRARLRAICDSAFHEGEYAK